MERRSIRSVRCTEVQAQSIVTPPSALALLTRTRYIIPDAFYLHATYTNLLNTTLKIYLIVMISSHRYESPQCNLGLGTPLVGVHPPIVRKKAKNATRDQKRDVKMAHICSLTTTQIMKSLHLIRR